MSGSARSHHEILHTNLATSIVHRYLEILAGNTHSEPPSATPPRPENDHRAQLDRSRKLGSIESKGRVTQMRSLA